jgi:hypothetical protein
MSDTNVHKLPTGAPIVPNFQAEPTTAAPSPGTLPDGLLDQIIARTVQVIESRPTRPSPFDLRSFEEIEAFAERMAKSALCPKDYQRKPDDILIAVLMGKEIGLPAMASVQSICVINGRPSVWGDAVPGLCMATGLVADVREWMAGDGAEATAYCEVTRRGMSPRLGYFSIAEARTAGLGNVHKQYPRDMIMWRARHRAWHGAFPDVLKGLGTAEIEAEEANRPVWVMPRPSRSDTARVEKGEGDTWDDAWFDDVAKALFEEQDPWKWMGILIKELAVAPTARDIQEIENLNSVTTAIKSAPEEIREQIALAFREAEARLGKPALAATPQREAPVQQAATTPAKPAAATVVTPPVTPAEGVGEPEFEYCVLDETGEPVDGVIYTDPLAWARALSQIADPTTMAYMALREHNADALADARQDPEAAKLLAAMEANADIRPDTAPVVIEPAIVRGKPDWTQYHTDLEAALARQNAGTLHGFTDAQRERVSAFPQSQRLKATRAVVTRASAIGTTPPAPFQAAPKEEKAEPTTPAADSVPGAAAPAPAATPPVDKDARQLETFREIIDGCRNVHEVRSFSNQATTTATLSRWDREERTELAAALRRAVAEKEAAFKVAA